MKTNTNLKDISTKTASKSWSQRILQWGLVNDRFSAQIQTNYVPKTNYMDCHSFTNKYENDTFSSGRKQFSKITNRWYKWLHY